MRTITLAPGERLQPRMLAREGAVPADITASAQGIIDEVRAGGDEALRRFCREFDGVDVADFRLPDEQVDAALEGLDPSFLAALEKAAAQMPATASVPPRLWM